MYDSSVTSTGPRRLSLRRNFSWVFAGNVIFAISQWIIIVLLAKFGSTKAVGQFGLALAVVSPVIMFASLHLRSVIATDADHKYRLVDYALLRFIMLGMATVAIAFFVWISPVHEELRMLVLFVAMGKILESTSDIIYGRFQQWERMNLIGQSQILKAVLCTCAAGWAAWYTGRAVWAAVGIVIARILGLLLFDLPMARIGKLGRRSRSSWRRGWNGLPSIRLNRTWGLFLTAAPLGLVMLLISLNANVSRYFIALHMGEEQLGIFLSMSYIVIVAGRLFNSLGQAASPRLAGLYTQGDFSGFRRLLYRLLGLAAAVGMLGLVVAWVGGKPLLTLCYTPEYSERVDVFVVLMLGGAISYVAAFSGYGMTATRQFRLQPVIVFCAFVAQTFLCWQLIPVFGLMGAAVANVSAPLVQLILMSICNHRATLQPADSDNASASPIACS